MTKRIYLFLILAATVIAACTDNDSFTTSRSNTLTFSCDTVSMDTVFSTVPTSTQSFWVFNNSGDGLRIRTVRLRRGNQSGFRVNVDGTFLDTSTGSQANDFEVREGDSLRVFVELTSPTNGSDEPQLVEDNLIFTLESGVEQNVCLRAYSWDAILLNNIHIDKDSTLQSSSKPIVVYGGITVDSASTLTISAPTKLYFHDGAGIDVYGRLIVNGNASQEVVMRGDRTDRMFSYLPYDRVSGQWRGIRFYGSSTGNSISHADIHSTCDAIICDSAAYDSTALRLSIDHTTIHNCKGYGLWSHNANICLSNCQISNTLGDCLAVYGGKATVIYCTLAQFYPFSGDRGVALRLANSLYGQAVPLYGFDCQNTLITGYASDELMGEKSDNGGTRYDYTFANSIVRTPAVTDTTLLAHFKDIIFETPTDSVEGKHHFVNVDETNLRYDFRLDSVSPARSRALPLPLYPDDRNAVTRSETPNIGCYE